MARAALPQRGLGRGTRQSRLKVPCPKLEPLPSSSSLGRGDERSSRGACAATLVAGRAVAAFVCNRRGCHRSQSCRRRSMRLCMILTCCMDSHRHVSTRASQGGVEMCSCWALFDVGMGSRATGCAVRIGTRLVATCLVITALAWRENGLARIDLFQRGEQPR